MNVVVLPSWRNLLLLSLLCACVESKGDTEDGTASMESPPEDPDETNEGDAGGSEDSDSGAPEEHSIAVLTANDVVASRTHTTVAEFQFELSEDALNGSLVYEEQWADGEPLCSDSLELAGEPAELVFCRDDCTWAYRMSPVELGTTACRVPLTYLQFLAPSSGEAGALFHQQDLTSGPYTVLEQILIGSQGESSSAAITVMMDVVEGEDLNPGAYDAEQGTVDFVLNEQRELETLWAPTCSEAPYEVDGSAVWVDEPILATVACRYASNYVADLWTVTLQPGQTLRAAALPEASRETVKLELIGADGCPEVRGGSLDDCPSDQQCATVKYTAETDEEVVLAVQSTGYCPDSTLSYELHIEVE